ncbi:ABC transporter ATP-binding protein [Haloparvum sp. PAK95]|uniref:ABC transporter ATP-binding protein n=1 Tax=Haloparvum sp. PAK95 TaxID=3418962 RepID=UPI003D2EF79F
MTDPLLAVEDLHVQFDTPDGTLRAVDGVSFTVDRGETVCLVGESGSGKTVSCEALTGLLPTPPGEVTQGTVRFDGADLTTYSETQLRAVRGDRIAHVFQNPQGALDPVYTVGEQLVEAIGYHRDVSKAAARERAIDLLDRVGIPTPGTRVDEYPHEFSGGMKQRVVVALALTCEPDLLVADEPTTALDVTTEAQLLDLLADLQAEFDMAILFVTHDLGVVAEIADRVVVMYGGKVMEQGDVFDVFDRTAHPYTAALMKALPGKGALQPIGGDLVDPVDPPDGCRFAPRCEHATPACTSGGQPPLYATGDGRRAPADDEVHGDATAGHSASCVYYGPHHDRDDLDLESDSDA